MDCIPFKIIRTVLLLSLAFTINLQAVATPSIEEYGSLPAANDVVISPSGDFFAFRKSSAEKKAVLVYSIKSGKLINGIDVSNIDPQDIYFISDDSLILVASQYKKLYNYRHAMDISTAYTYNFKKNDIKQLIKPGQPLRRKSYIYTGQTNMGTIIGLSADKKYIFTPAYVASSDLDQSPNYSLLKIPANGKGSPKVFDKGNDDTTDFFMDDKGNLLARESYDEKKKKHILESKVSGKWKAIYEYETDLITRSFVGLTNDFKKIVFLVYENNNNFSTYYAMSLNDGSIEKLPFNKVGTDVEKIIVNPNRVAVGVRYSGFTPSYRFFDPKLQKRMDEIQKTFAEHSVWLVSWSTNFKDLVIKVEGSNYAGDFLLFSENKEPLFIASARPNLKPEDIHPLGTATYKARDGLAIPTLITIPRDKLSNFKNLPAVLMPHGGPASYDTIEFDFMAQALASRGYLVIQPQFRGSEGFGWKHESAGYGEWGKKMQDDLTDAVDFFVKKGMVDPNRICIAGASYGGYAALAGATFTPDTYKCAYSLAGISHIPHMLKADKSRYGKNSRVISYFKLAIGGGAFDKQALKDISPYYFAKNVKIPIMLAHGEDDTIVEFKQSKLMYSALKKAKANVELIKLKDEDHHLQDQETRLQAITALVDFVDKHISTPQ